MPQILVHPDRLRLLAEQWRKSGSELQGLADRLATAVDEMDLGGFQDVEMGDGWVRARKLASGLVAEAETYSRSLRTMADRFEEADRSGAGAVGQVAEGFAPMLRRWKAWWYDAQQSLALPRQQVDQLLSMAGQSSAVAGLAAASLPGLVESAAASFGGLRNLQPLSPTWQGRLAQAAQDAISRALDRGEGGYQETGS